MADQTRIEWTDATWNPVTGCTKISPGCDHCYAERFAERFRGVAGHPYQPGFDLTLRPKRLDQPLGWASPRMIFVNSMSDLFHKDIPFDYIDQVFDRMERADWHIFQVLTKRSSRLRTYLRHRYRDRPAARHIWIGVSIEDDARMSRVDHLRQAPAFVRFLSVEPLLGPLDRLDLTAIDWVIAGGESGPGARCLEIAWLRDLRDRCLAANVAFFFKQWGGLRPKSNGRLLDGVEWSQYPAVGEVWLASPPTRAGQRGADC